MTEFGIKIRQLGLKSNELLQLGESSRNQAN